MNGISRMLLRVFGWQVIDEIPGDLRQYIVAVAPHTSWKDFPLGLLVRSAIGRRIAYLGKQELFDGPMGFFFRWSGGFPVNRKLQTGLVDQVAALFATHPDFAIAIAPEGTRRKVEDLKTGFYYMAVKAGVPIIPCTFDFGHKTVHFMPPFYPTTDTHADLDTLWALYAGVKGANPEKGPSGMRKREK